MLQPEMAYNPGMPVPSYNDDEMDDYGMCDYRDEDGGYRPPPDYVDRNYRPYPRDQCQRRDFDYNHGMNMPPNHGRDKPPYRYGPMPPTPYNHHGPSDCGPDMYDGRRRYSDHHGRSKQRDHDFYYSGANVILGPNGPDMHRGPPGPNMHPGPPRPHMHNSPDLHHGPPGPRMRNGPDKHQGPRHNIHNGPNMHHRPPGPNMHHGPPGSNMHNGPLGPDVCNGFLGSDAVCGPQASNIYHGLPVSDIHQVTPPGSSIPYRPPLPSFHVPPGSGIHQGPPNSDIHPPPPPPPGQRPGPEIHMGPLPPGPEIHMGPLPPGPEIHMGPLPPGPEIRLGPPPGPDIILGPPPVPMHEIYPGPPHHLSPLYHSRAPSAQPITVPPPPPQCFPAISAPVSSSQKFPSENSSSLPPLPPSPPREARPPTPPSPSPPSPHPLPSNSSLPVSQRSDAYDPDEALFSPTSSNSPELSEKQEESIIKYVKSAQKLKSSSSTGHSAQKLKSSSSTGHSAQKLKSSSSTGHSAKLVENAKVVKTPQVSKKTECQKPSILEESPTRPNLDARLKLMFGTTADNESPKKKEKKKSPTKSSRSKRGETKETDRPLSPPPSPFQSRQMYHYWHKVTLNLRKSFSTSSVDFVSAKAVSSILSSSNDVKSQFGKDNTVNIPPKPVGLPLPKSMPTVPPPNYKSSMTEQILPKKNSLKPESSTKNVHRMHPYKTSVSKGQIVQSSLDSELEISCDISPEDGMSDGDSKNNVDDGSQSVVGDKSSKETDEVCHNDDFEIQDDSDPDFGSKTVGVVLSKIISELKYEIQKVYGTVIDDEIQKFIEKHKS